MDIDLNESRAGLCYYFICGNGHRFLRVGLTCSDAREMIDGIIDSLSERLKACGSELTPMPEHIRRLTDGRDAV
jgi:hypothetical protein